VTAQRRAQSVQDVPLTVNAFDAETLEERQVDSLADVTALTAGVKFSEQSNVGNINIRGVGTALISGGGEGSAAIHIDGVYLPQVKAFALAQFDLGAIEILRGPQGTLYGRNSTAGVINIQSKRPTNVLSAGVFMGYGNYNLIRGGIYVSGPVADGLNARVYAQKEGRDSYIYNSLQERRLKDSTSFGGRFALDWTGSPGFESELRYTHVRQEGAELVQDAFDESYPILPPGFYDFDPYRVSVAGEYAGKRGLDLVSWRNTFDIADGIQLVSLSGYSNFTSDNLFDVFGSAIPAPETTSTDTDTYSQELIVKGDTGTLDWLLGAFYMRRDEENHTFADFSNILGSFTIIDQESRQTSASVFADATFHLSDATRVFAGARYLKETLDQDLYVAAIVGEDTIVQCAPDMPTQRSRDDAFTGRVGIQQDLSDDVMFYGQASRGYKAPGFSQSACGNSFDPETVNALEAGVKSMLLDRRLRLNLSAFYYDIKNLQIEIANPLGIPAINVPKSESYGAELEASFRPTSDLTLDASVSWLHARYKRFLNQDTNLGVPVGASLAGNALNNSPNFSANLGARYRISIGRGSLTPQANIYMTTKYQVREVNQPYLVQDGYTQTNMSLTYRLDDDQGFYIRGYVKNLENEAVLAGVTAFGGVMGPFQPPRTYGFELGADF